MGEGASHRPQAGRSSSDDVFEEEEEEEEAAAAAASADVGRFGMRVEAANNVAAVMADGRMSDMLYALRYYMFHHLMAMKQSDRRGAGEENVDGLGVGLASFTRPFNDRFACLRLISRASYGRYDTGTGTIHDTEFCWVSLGFVLFRSCSCFTRA